MHVSAWCKSTCRSGVRSSIPPRQLDSDPAEVAGGGNGSPRPATGAVQVRECQTGQSTVPRELVEHGTRRTSTSGNLTSFCRAGRGIGNPGILAAACLPTGNHFRAFRCLASHLVGLRGVGGEDRAPLVQVHPPTNWGVLRRDGGAIPPANVVAGVPSQSPVNAVYKRLQRSRVVPCSLVVTTAPTEGYALSHCQIRTYKTGGHGIRFPPPTYDADGPVN